MPGTILSPCIISFTLHSNLWSRSHFYPHFTDDETKAKGHWLVNDRATIIINTLGHFKMLQEFFFSATVFEPLSLTVLWYWWNNISITLIFTNGKTKAPKQWLLQGRKWRSWQRNPDFLSLCSLLLSLHKVPFSL